MDISVTFEQRKAALQCRGRQETSALKWAKCVERASVHSANAFQHDTVINIDEL